MSTPSDADRAALADRLTRAEARRTRRFVAGGVVVLLLAFVAVIAGLTRGGSSDTDDPDAVVVDPALVAVLDELDRLQARLADYQRDIGTLDAAFAAEDAATVDRTGYDAGLALSGDTLRLNVEDSAAHLAQIETSPGTAAERAAARAAIPFERAADWAAAYPEAVRSGDRSRLDEIDEEVRTGMIDLCSALRSEVVDAETERRVDALCGDF